MDSVSLETSNENEWIKQRLVDGKVSNFIYFINLVQVCLMHVPTSFVVHKWIESVNKSIKEQRKFISHNWNIIMPGNNC